mmetsp:Transcript_30708/g.65380  ORF Transcript_30708/g.65380 Transcript_30708/m.65380 type:complete len:234 (-) Transcript_30708:369-1070(-)
MAAVLPWQLSKEDLEVLAGDNAYAVRIALLEERPEVGHLEIVEAPTLAAPLTDGGAPPAAQRRETSHHLGEAQGPSSLSAFLPPSRIHLCICRAVAQLHKKRGHLLLGYSASWALRKDGTQTPHLSLPTCQGHAQELAEVELARQEELTLRIQNRSGRGPQTQPPQRPQGPGAVDAARAVEVMLAKGLGSLLDLGSAEAKALAEALPKEAELREGDLGPTTEAAGRGQLLKEL